MHGFSRPARAEFYLLDNLFGIVIIWHCNYVEWLSEARNRKPLTRRQSAFCPLNVLASNEIFSLSWHFEMALKCSSVGCERLGHQTLFLERLIWSKGCRWNKSKHVELELLCEGIWPGHSSKISVIPQLWKSMFASERVLYSVINSVV